MSRFYDITITQEGSSKPLRHWTSHPNGVYDPGALNVEFDMPISLYHTPPGAQSITIHGISREDLSQAYQFASDPDRNIKMGMVIRGGMKAGLPLVNPAQAGIIASGEIIQAFGNWEGTEMTLDLIMYPSTYTDDDPGNLVLHWPAGTPLSQALTQTFGIAYPALKVNANISSDLVNSYDVVHFTSTLEGMAGFIAEFTKGASTGLVGISMQSGKIMVSDSTYTPPPPIQLAFTDLIGQPTWIKFATMQIKTILRADLEIGSMIRMPQGFPNAPGFVTTPGSGALSTDGAALPSTGKNKTIFQNNFQITELRQLGHFRSPDASQWATIFNCVTSGN
jgi:hypothetical protein